MANSSRPAPQALRPVETLLLIPSVIAGGMLARENSGGDSSLAQLLMSAVGGGIGAAIGALFVFLYWARVGQETRQPAASRELPDSDSRPR